MSLATLALGLLLGGDLRAPSPGPQPIVGGDVVEPGAYPEVVALRLPGNAICSGVSVAEDLVLTAAHCVNRVSEFQTITIDLGDRIDGTSVPVDTWGFHFAFRSDAKLHDVHDYAYVVPVDPLPGPFAIPITTQSDWEEAMQYDQSITLVGYGEEGDGGLAGIKREVTVPIVGFSEQGLEFRAGAEAKDTCEGDSGGAAFVTLADGRRMLAGLTSRGPNPCGKYGIYSVPHPSLCWVRDSTGTDLTGDCSSCDCIDTTPPDLPKNGCGCRNGDASAAWSWVMLLMLARRRRR